MKRLQHSIEYHIPVANTRKSVEFYKDRGVSVVMTVRATDGTGLAVDIYCDGNMKIVDTRDGEVYWEGADLIAAGIDSDKKLSELVDAGVLDVQLNPWFDLYAEGEHIDDVSHDIEDALAGAKAYLIDLSEGINKLESLMA